MQRKYRRIDYQSDSVVYQMPAGCLDASDSSNLSILSNTGFYCWHPSEELHILHQDSQITAPCQNQQKKQGAGRGVCVCVCAC